MIDVPNNDKRKFNYGKLKNNIKYINVQNTELDKNDSNSTSIAVSVKIGSIADPLEFQGLAHFLEHMLFMGSKKYPDENTFQKILSENGGNSNAWTGSFETVYYLSVINTKIEKVIDIFSRFFIDPLFKVNSVDREINAIESEHLKNKNNDDWMLYHFIKKISKKNSNINKFSTGNIDSLKKSNIRDKMIEFYNKWYIPENINIVTSSSLDTKIIKSYIEKYFGKIKNKKINIFKIEKPLYNSYPEYFFYKSNNEDDNLTYVWEIPNEELYKYTHSHTIITETIMDNNIQSLKNILINLGLIKHVSSGTFDFGVIIITFDLIDMKYWNIVDSYFKYYLKQLCNKDWNKIGKYYKKKQKLNFHYGTKIDDIDICTKLVSNMLLYPVEKSYIGNEVPDKINTLQILEILNEYMNFKKVKIILSNNNDKGSLNIPSINIKDKEYKDKYYNFKYYKIDLSFLNDKKINFDITKDNSFINYLPIIIKNLDDNIIPRKYSKNFFYGSISKFHEPIVFASIILNNINFINNISNYTNYIILCKFINFKISKQFYLEEDAGYICYLTHNSNFSNININFKCYNTNFNLFLKNIISYILNYKYGKDDIIILKKIILSFKEDISKFKNNSPWKISKHIIFLNTNEFEYRLDDITKLLEKYNYNKFFDILKKLINDMFKNSYQRTFIYGNIRYTDIKPIQKYIQRNINNATYYHHKIKKLQNIDIFHYNKDEDNNYLQISYYIGRFNISNNSMCIIARLMINEPFFDILRTKKQFGYIVKFDYTKYGDYYYLTELVQSTKSIETIKKNILKFNKTIKNLLTDTNFKNFKQAALDLLNEKETSIREYYSKFFNEINLNRFDFNIIENTIKEIKKIKFSSFKKFVEEYLINATPIYLIIRCNKDI